MNTQYSEISRVSVTEGRFLVHYILVLGYTPSYDEPANDDGTVDRNDPDWDVRLYRRVDIDGIGFDDRHDRISFWLDNPEERAPTVDDVDSDTWQAIFDAAKNAYGWHSWDNWMTSFRM